MSGRDVPVEDIGDMVGLFINTLPFQVGFEGGVGTLDLLRSLQEQRQADSVHGWVSLGEINAWTNSASRFESILVFENYPVDRDGMAQATRQLPFMIGGVDNVETTNYPLAAIIDARDELTIDIGYDAARLDTDMVERLAFHFEVLLEALVSDVSADPLRVGLLTPEEACRLRDWNATSVDYPRDRTVVDLFEAQVSANPDGVALVYEGEELSYGALNARANGVARRLIGEGIGPDRLVGICVERSFEMVAGLLGVLKAGGAYVPLDPDYPEDRLSFMLSDSGADIVLTQTRLCEEGGALSGLLSGYGGTTLCLDDAAAFEGGDVTNPVRRASPDDLAYVIYTSGSTGRPKGVMVEHGGLSVSAPWPVQLYERDRKRLVKFKPAPLMPPWHTLLVNCLQCVRRPSERKRRLLACWPAAPGGARIYCSIVECVLHYVNSLSHRFWAMPRSFAAYLQSLPNSSGRI